MPPPTNKQIDKQLTGRWTSRYTNRLASRNAMGCRHEVHNHSGMTTYTRLLIGNHTSSAVVHELGIKDMHYTV